jgi:hypothetical protein
MNRTPYSPFVLKATAPLPWKEMRWLRVRSSGLGSGSAAPVARLIPTVFLGIEFTGDPANPSIAS